MIIVVRLLKIHPFLYGDCALFPLQVIILFDRKKNKLYQKWPQEDVSNEETLRGKIRISFHLLNIVFIFFDNIENPTEFKHDLDVVVFNI